MQDFASASVCQMENNAMKCLLDLIPICVLLSGQPAAAELSTAPAERSIPSHLSGSTVRTNLPLAPGLQSTAQGTESRPALTRFDLDFPGGTPADLRQAIERASGKPLNLVIPIDAANTPLPPLKMRSVTVSDLFNALRMASQATSRSETRVYTKRQKSISGEYQGPAFYIADYIRYDFQTVDHQPTDESVWYFSSGINEKPTACRFWQLAPYLETYTVDDITTAIQTGYKMLGDTAPTINFHKETKLLIAVGAEGKLALIDAVLQQLQDRKEPTRSPGK
jgi:hypothetical protein